MNTRNIISNLLLGTGVIFILYGLSITSIPFLTIGLLIWIVGVIITK